MKEIDGYLDITPGDFKALYGVAHRHAIARLTEVLGNGGHNCYFSALLRQEYRLISVRYFSSNQLPG